MSGDVIDWLLEGDSVIRWQVMRYLLGQPQAKWENQRKQTVTAGWVAQFLQHQRPDGTWKTGRWTDTLWTLLLLMDCGVPADCEPVRSAAERFIGRHLPPDKPVDRKWLLTRMDQCHLGFWLRIGSYFLGKDDRLKSVADVVLGVQMDDGGWNCRTRNYPDTVHSSFHTTFNILEGLRVAAEAGNVGRSIFRKAERRALEFMLVHQMYRSDKTGKIISDRFTHLTHPSHWHYTVLRGLDYMRACPEIKDRRLDDACKLVERRRNARGRWIVEKRIPGDTHFDMEPMGADSRWNTLRALRVLRAREG